MLKEIPGFACRIAIDANLRSPTHGRSLKTTINWVNLHFIPTVFHNTSFYMKVIIPRNASKDEIRQTVSQLKQNAPELAKKKSLSDFVGTLKGVYGDGLEYQKTIRNEWDGLPGWYEHPHIPLIEPLTLPDSNPAIGSISLFLKLNWVENLDLLVNSFR